MLMDDSFTNRPMEVGKLPCKLFELNVRVCSDDSPEIDWDMVPTSLLRDKFNVETCANKPIDEGMLPVKLF